MDVSLNTLRKETVQTYQQAQKMLEEGFDDFTPLKRKELLASLLLTKAQCLNALTLLNEQGKRK